MGEVLSTFCAMVEKPGEARMIYLSQSGRLMTLQDGGVA